MKFSKCICSILHLVLYDVITSCRSIDRALTGRKQMYGKGAESSGGQQVEYDAGVCLYAGFLVSDSQETYSRLIMYSQLIVFHCLLFVRLYLEYCVQLWFLMIQKTHCHTVRECKQEDKNAFSDAA